MQKLKSNSGAALVTAVVFAAITSIMIAGILYITTSITNGQLIARDDDRSFRAAESGLSMGLAWVRANNNFPDNFGTITPFPDFSLNRQLVRVRITETTAPTGAPSVSVTSEVYDTSKGAISATTFRKRLSQSATQSTYGEYATFFDDLSGTHADWGGFIRREFIGRFHMNTYIEINSGATPGGADEVVFSGGKVTVANSDAAGKKNYGAGTHDGNVYNNGVLLNSGRTGAQAITDLDKIFTSGYDGNAAAIAIPTGLTTSQFATDPRRINLPASVDDGEAYNNYRPTLEFLQSGGVYTAKYNYKVGGVLKDTTFAFYTDKIFIAPTNLNVMGTVQGKVTVATTTGKSIMPVGDIVYADYNSTTQEVPLNSTNVLGLVSGKHIRYNDQWYKQFKTGTVGQQSIGVGTNNTLEINGSMIAVETGSGWKGAGWWDENRAINYDFRLTGTQMMKAWDAPSNGSKGAQGYLTFNHDLRLISSISPPGYPAVKTTAGLILITATGWSESNTY